MTDHHPEAATERQAISDLCTAWGLWQREANCIAPQGGRGLAGHTMPSATYTQLIRLHDAVQRQPPALDRRVFELYHLHAVRNIKLEAARLGVSRTHFYRLLWAFERRVYREAQFLAERQQMDPSWARK